MKVYGVMQSYTNLVNTLKSKGLYDKNNPPVVSAGASLVLYGVKKETDDLDVSVSKEIWDALDIPEVEGISVKIKRLRDATVGCDIDIHIDDGYEFSKLVHFFMKGMEKVSSLNIAELINERKRLGREKDMAAIKLIDDWVDAGGDCEGRIVIIIPGSAISISGLN